MSSSEPLSPPSQAEPESKQRYDPSSFLHEITGNNVIVKLHSGIEYHGRLQSVDGFMNIALESTKEVINKKEIMDWGDVFLRGHNVIYISAA
ncbi:uncharacterized protein SAPINGB_P003504 [Magnusiomyces paraingens]|uniref:Sm domain-containing protein n=1 Tax=Magnusiomyces paraingens TaxID=2606893 RepID=A0A5E8BQK3_9ASCO|nr:uncharacterized protein SAPINGB_P003504 [Saprochaete ingens]VVT53301.1 unnamed protein product [Saprochaete ingens]